MRKHGLKFFAVLGLCAAFASGAQAAPSIYNLLSHRGVMKVYLAEFTDATGGNVMDLADLKTKLAEALKNRKTLSFAIVETEADADLVISVKATEYLWSETDPVDMIAGLGLVAFDAMSNEHYVRMQAVFTIKDAKNQRELWKDTVLATLTSNTLTKENSVKMVNADLVKMFLREAFSKNKT